MIIEPDHLLEAFAKAGATRINVHWEACPNLHRTLQAIKALGCQAGVAINPHTPASFISEILPLLDAVLVMTVNPGFGGQAFLPEMLPKIRTLREMIGKREIEIAVDGGINAETASQVTKAGAKMLVVGSAIFNNRETISDAMAKIRRAVEKEKPV
jgi:ribulose-phosphate 3-epimerase